MSSERTAVNSLEPPPTPLRPKFVACRKCHARKVKCPGGHPCRTCVQMGCEAECIYPTRNRQVRVSESYIESILQQNQRLRARLQAELGEDLTENTDNPQTFDSTSPASEPSQNPVLDEKPWFIPLHSFTVPLRIGEPANTAFATRFRQAISKTPVNHIPRLSYPNEDQILAASQSNVPHLSSAQARFLIQIALANIEHYCHIIRKSTVWAILDQFIEAPSSLNLFLQGKIFALLALGELHSSGSSISEGQITPGLAYFGRASQAYGTLVERPCIESIEVSLLLCLYSLSINRWHSASFLASSAIRHCIVMGLHLEVPEKQLGDEATREHLRRVWWSSYLLDHTCAVLSGQMVSTHDDEIYLDFPSDKAMAAADAADFGKSEYICVRIELFRLLRKVVHSIYGREKSTAPFLQRIQSGLRELKQWHHAVPEALKIGCQNPSAPLKERNSLHLFFNQCIMVTTRSLLLHMVRVRESSSEANPQGNSHVLSESVRSLAEACVHCARHSLKILVDSWIDRSFKTFDYAYTQYLFSVATILAMSSHLGGPESSKDGDDFGLASGLIKKLQDSGSFAAIELNQHMEATKAIIGGFSRTELSQDVPQTIDNTPANQHGGVYQEPSHGTDGTSAGTISIQPQTFGNITEHMALSEPSIEAFLLQDDFSLEQMATPDFLFSEGFY